ncbi:MAG: 30S ribosomal protein S1 [Anaerolineae bacterium]
MVLETHVDGSEGAANLEVEPFPPPEAAQFTAPDATLQAPPAQGSDPDAQALPEDDSGSALAQVMLEALEQGQPKRGELWQGVITAVRPTELVVDVGAKRQCVVSASDYQKLGSEFTATLREGAKVTVYIIKPEDREGHLAGSLYLAQLEADWNRAEEMERSGEIFEARVSGQNRGGLLVPLGHLRGFVPASHLVGTTSSEEAQRPAALSYWIGKTLAFKVIEVNRRRNRLILSYRAARRQWRSQQRRSLLDEIHEGDVRRGIVSSLANFGAFVDLGGADGLIHISEMAWYRVEHPSEVLQVGQDVEVYVLRVDGARGRVGLSLKRLQQDPWSVAESKYRPGQLLEATIVKLVDFGAFAELEKGVEGLIHITEMAEPAPTRPEEVVQPGDRRLLKVLRVDAQNRRIGLSLKAVTADEAERWSVERAGAQPTPASKTLPAADAS